MSAERKWTEKRVAGTEGVIDGLFVRVAVGELHDAYADFEVLEEEINVEARDGADPCRRRCIARGHVKFDGCMNADLEVEAGGMQHWCTEQHVIDFGRALVEVRRLAAAVIPKWMGD